MKWKRWLPVSLLAVSAACWHQVVNTGSTAGTTVVDKPWVTTWLWGLIAAEPIDIRQQCPRGAAVIETETSFVNGLASLVTLGIWTPQHVRVTCASGTASLPPGATEIRIPVDASVEQRGQFVSRAIEQSLETHAPVVLRF